MSLTCYKGSSFSLAQFSVINLAIYDVIDKRIGGTYFFLLNPMLKNDVISRSLNTQFLPQYMYNPLKHVIQQIIRFMDIDLTFCNW